MRVRLKKPTRRYTEFTFGNVYRVIGIEADDYRIMNDDGQPYLYPAKLFELIDRHQPESWIKRYGEDGEMYAYPHELSRPGFFEDWFEHKRSALATLELTLRRERESERKRVTKRQSAQTSAQTRSRRTVAVS